MPRILMVLDKSFPPDLRVENEARTLQDAGYDVTILAIGPDGRAAVDDLDGIRIVRDRMSGFLRNKMRGLSGSVPLLSWYLGRRIRALHAEYRFDALHAHDLYLFGGVLRAGRRLGLRVFGDMHENWVDALRHYRWSSRYPGKLFAGSRRWARLEREWSMGMDHVFVVIGEMAERLRDAGVPEQRLSVVPNTVRLEEFDSWPLERVYPDDRPRIVYTGGMDGHRGLEDAVRAMRSLSRTHPDVELVLVGDGATRAELEALATSEGVAERIRFEGWQRQERVKSFLHGCQIGLIPHKKTIQTDHVIPHKLFHYMRMGLPVVVSDCTPLMRIVQEAGCGKVYTSGDAEALADRLDLLLNDEMLQTSLGENGSRIVARKYNWDATVYPLVETYDRLVRKGQG